MRIAYEMIIEEENSFHNISFVAKYLWDILIWCWGCESFLTVLCSLRVRGRNFMKLYHWMFNKDWNIIVKKKIILKILHIQMIQYNSLKVKYIKISINFDLFNFSENIIRVTLSQGNSDQIIIFIEFSIEQDWFDSQDNSSPSLSLFLISNF